MLLFLITFLRLYRLFIFLEVSETVPKIYEAKYEILSDQQRTEFTNGCKNSVLYLNWCNYANDDYLSS